MKRFLYLFFLLSTISFAQQQIAIIGSATENLISQGYQAPILLYEAYNQEGLFVSDAFELNEGYIQFQDVATGTIYGGTDYPSGSFNGGQIEVIAGLYYIEINLEENTYELNVYPQVNIGWSVNYGVSLFETEDLIHFKLPPREFDTGYRFINEDTHPHIFEWNEVGSPDFPSGIANQYHPIPIEEGYYRVFYNYESKAYSFEVPSISLVGSAVVTNDDDELENEVNLSSENGFIYTLGNVYLEEGELNFRQDNNWEVSWSGTGFPVGELIATDAETIQIEEAGFYSVEFNRQDETYSFATLSVDDFEINTIEVYPNPTNNSWNFSIGENTIDEVQIYDLSGRMVYQSTFNETNTFEVNASNFSQGMYLAKLVNKQGSIKTLKLIKN